MIVPVSPEALDALRRYDSATISNFGCVGIIANGAARDIAAIRPLGFAAFASSLRVSHGYGRSLDIHQPVQVEGLTVRHGDLIHADGNGIVNIPISIAEQVAMVCPHYVEAEELVSAISGTKA